MSAVLRSVNRSVLRPVSRSQRASIYTIQAPTGGWNAKDSLDDMPEDQAISMDNMFPGFGKVSLRNGSSSYATGLGADVYTLAEFNAASNRKFIAGADGKIWDISSAGAGSSLKTGFTGSKWQWAQFDDASGGARMGLVNGVDAPQVYNGTSVTAMSISATGLTVATLIGVNIYKNRSYFWDGVTQNFYYSATNALGGVLGKFPLGRVTGLGGNLIAMGTWTVDGGTGVNDLAVFVMSSGVVAIYSGSNPGDATDWSLVGVFNIGAPLGVRGVTKVGSDLVIMTKDGYVPLSKVLSTGRTQPSAAISDRIRNAVGEAAISYGSNFGWQSVHYPRGNMALFNVPLSSGTFHQHVVNTATGAWCRFTGWNGRTFATYNDKLYYGLNGTVYLADDGRADGSTVISGDTRQAWNYFKARGRKKRATMMRVMGAATGPVNYSLSIGSDFRDPRLAMSGSTGDSGTSGGASWDTADWDTADWPNESLTFDRWGSAGVDGYCFSHRLQAASATQGFDWYATAYAYETGGIL